MTFTDVAQPLPRLVAFDLDDTLAPSKTEAPETIVDLLLRLLEKTQVAVISGGNFEQFQNQLLKPLQKRISETTNFESDISVSDTARSDTAGSDIEDLLKKMHLLPTCGTRFYQRESGDWKARYIEDLTFEERASAHQTLEQEAQRLGLWESMVWGQIIEDRGSQITFSALGQRAPVEAKEIWDPTNQKKNALRDAVQSRLPNLEVRSGGSTSVDITRKGIDKAYGMRKLHEHTGISLDDMLFIGDRLDEDGNDYPVKAMGVRCIAVTGWQDTQELLATLLSR